MCNLLIMICISSEVATTVQKIGSDEIHHIQDNSEPEEENYTLGSVHHAHSDEDLTRCITLLFALFRHPACVKEHQEHQEYELPEENEVQLR